MTKWEYNSFSTDYYPEEDMDALGADGWELVAALTFDGKQHFYFKREVYFESTIQIEASPPHSLLGMEIFH